MNKEELSTFNTDDWRKCINIIDKYWNSEYGTFVVEKKDNSIMLILITGGWSENEEIINIISNTISGSYGGKKVKEVDIIGLK